MKAKLKSAKKVKKKPAARKKVTTAVRKKKAVGKPAKKVTPAKKARKAAPKPKTKKPATRKKAQSATQKKKTSMKPAKPSPARKKTVSAERPVTTLIEETIVTVTTAMPGNGFPIPASTGILIGKVVHFYNHSNVAILELDTGYLRVGDTIHIKGHTTDFEQVVESIEIEHQNIETAETGQTVGVKVREVVREHDRVYRKAESS